MYLLDANIISHLVKHPDGAVARRLAGSAGVAVAPSIVVAAELRYGLETRRSPDLTARVERALELLSVLPLEADADCHYGRLRADLRRRGLPIGANAMLIAAHALSLDATLVTDNVREFERIDGLRVENWLRDD